MYIQVSVKERNLPVHKAFYDDQDPKILHFGSRKRGCVVQQEYECLPPPVLSKSANGPIVSLKTSKFI